MNIKGLLIGSAAAVVAASSAQAADAIIFAEPEPLEYVRICDTYGAGFFYIPGTQNCMQIGGYVRVQIDGGRATVGGVRVASGYASLARFAPSVDVRSETEWGTLRAFGHIFFDHWSTTGTELTVEHAFIEIDSGAGALLLGKTDNPYARFFYGAAGAWDGDYGGQIYNANEISYHFKPGNGFEAIVAVVDQGGLTTGPNIEGGLKFGGDWGSIGGLVGYDNVADEWGAQGVIMANFAPFTLGVHALYSSDPLSVYGAAHPFAGGLTSEWSVLAHASVDLTDTLSANAYAQWFDGVAGLSDAWQVKGGLIWEPVSGLQVLPEVRYTRTSGVGNAWEGRLRFNRYF